MDYKTDVTSNPKIEPMAFVEGFDYSMFGKYIIKKDEELNSSDKRFKNQLLGAINISALMEKIRFEKSHLNIGLQAVDIIANCVRRGMVGNLQFDGWKYLEKLIVHRRDQAITVQRLRDNLSEYGVTPYGRFVTFLQKYGKNMLVS